MEFLNPAALYAFVLLPLLLVPYLIKGRPRRLLFSSLLLLREFSSRSAARPWGRLYLPLSFFLQLLLLLLLLLALGEPVLSLRPLNIAIVIDNSASMQAMEEQRSRFQMAQDEATDLLQRLPARARVDLYLTAPRLERIKEEALSPRQAISVISSLKAYDLAEPAADYGAELARLVKERGYERLYFLTDHSAQGQSQAVRVISLGRPRGNLAITSFEVTPSSLGSAQLRARAVITNFSSKEEKLMLVLKGEGKLLFSRPYMVASRKSAEASFENLPFHPYYEAEIKVSDGLALDNRRFAVPPPSKDLKILAVSPRPQPLSSLRSIPGVDMTVVSPQAYVKGAGDVYSLEIFHYSAPAVLPQNNALFVLPPKENPVAAVGAALTQPVISGWREPHPLTHYINFALFRPAYARALKPQASGEAIIQSPEGPLVIALEQGGFRYLVLGFDPFPFLGRENLPMSIFTLNLLGWFHRARGGTGSATGEPLYLQVRQGAFLLTPAGEKVPLTVGSAVFSGAYFQGIYQVGRGGERRFIAVNFQDAKESDLASAGVIQLREESSAAARRSFSSSLWPYLVFISLVLLVLEWLVNPPDLGPRYASESAYRSSTNRARREA